MRPVHFLVLAILSLSLFPTLDARAQASSWDGLTVVVTGANRGLGLEFAQQLTAAGATVIGTARKPDEADELKATGARVEQLDVADAESVAAFAQRLEGVRVDVLLNNAGVMSNRGAFRDLDLSEVEWVLAVNTIGPMRVTQALLDNMRESERKLIMNMSSGLGSIANSQGGFSGYRESKAALNMFTHSLAAELKGEGFICIAMSPGWVRTDMGGDQAPLSPAQSIEGMLKVLAGCTTEDSGRYLGHDGAELPW